MSDAINILPGSVATIGSAKFWIASDTPLNGVDATHQPDRTRGLIVTDRLPDNPTSLNSWTIQGFTVRVRFALRVNVAPGLQYWARLGKLWAGISVNSPVARPVDIFSWPVASFPNDMSMFTLIWDGATDDINVTDAIGAGSDFVYTIVTETFQLPFPQTFASGTQLSFCLILTPSIVDPCLDILFREISYSIVYTENNLQRT